MKAPDYGEGKMGIETGMPMFAAVTFIQGLSALKDIVTVAGAFFAAYIAWQGLSTWRRQLKGNTEYELARRYLIATFRVRDLIRMIRGSLIIGQGEILQSMKEAGLSGEQMAQVKDDNQQVAMVYSMWLKRVGEALAALEIEELQSEVVWDRGHREITAPLKRCAHELGVAIPKRFSLLARQSDRTDHSAVIRKYDEIVWKKAEGFDEYDSRLAIAVSDIESMIKPRLRV